MLAIINHFSELSTGLTVGVSCLLFLYLVGVIATPNKFAPRAIDNEYPIILGATFWVVWCWFGIKFGVAVVPLSKGFFFVFIGLFLARLRYFDFENLKAVIFGKTVRHTLLAFVFFYGLSYFFCPPSVSGDYLPIVNDYNNDVFNYVNYTSYLLRLGPSNVYGLDYMGITYAAAPAVYYFMAMLSTFFDHEPMRAAMPVLYLTVALIACNVVALARTAFTLSLPLSILIAAILICGPFFRYVSGYYFLGQLMGWVVLLALFLRTARLVRTGGARLSLATALTFVPYYVLLLFIYPVLFLMGWAAHVGFLLLIHAFSSNSASLRAEERAPFLKRAAVTISLMVTPAALAALLDPRHFWNMIGWVGVLSAGNFGWTLDLISPWAIIGIAGPVELNQIPFKGALATYLLGFVILLYACCVRLRKRFTALEKAFLFLSFLSFISYFAYFWLVGPSYQQWKFASYFPLMLSFTILCAAGRIALILSSGSDAQKSGSMNLTSVIVVALLGALFIGVNAEQYVRQPRRQPISANYADLTALEHIGNSHEIYVQMNSYRSTFFPVYFIKNKVLHLLSPSYYPMEAIDLEQISPDKPLFVEGATCDSKHTERAIAIGALGCLYFMPPTVDTEIVHRFGESLWGVSTTGFAHQEFWGKWSAESKVSLVISATSQEIDKIHEGFVNFELNPYLPHGIAAQSVRISWGRKSHRGVIASPGWVSLPYSSDDWSGSRVRTLRIEFELPDAIAPRDIDKTSADSRKLGVGFSALSITAKPVGRVLEVVSTLSESK
jgi:hypothetical protein